MVGIQEENKASQSFIYLFYETKTMPSMLGI
ncbi:hypothetical protein OIU74_029682 [Salix koriyanagi]|uniref:Uncharacterized protein n=1 Tax=Salix koriyanagi TaxID=2511006 RepID=A0A9Q0VEE4_9ROSI|nr:hypothetical protein OIU74_029682 [Salix koriyanagi]